MFGIGGDAQRYGSLSTARAGQPQVAEADSAEAAEAVAREVVVDAAVAVERREEHPRSPVRRLVNLRVLLFPAWTSSTRNWLREPIPIQR